MQVHEILIREEKTNLYYVIVKHVISKRYHFLLDLMKRMKIIIQVSPYLKLMN